jgi:DNA-binding NarL/FixJ family response regulator
MDKLATQNQKDLAKNSGVIRVLLFSDSQTARLIHLFEHHRPVRVVSKANTADELMLKAHNFQPDVIVMLAHSDTPTAEFERAILRLKKAQLTGRVVLMAGSPAAYLNLAVKARLAGLFPLDTGYCEAVSAICEVRASFGDTDAPTTNKNNQAGPGLIPNQEVAEM